MKKWILLLLCIATALSALTACSGSNDKNQESGIEADEIDWENIVLCEVLPEPQSELMDITLNSKSALQADVYEISTNNFLEYIRLCEDAGFDINASRGGSTLFSANNEDGYSLTLTYAKADDKMTINLVSGAGSGETVSASGSGDTSKLDAEDIYDRCASSVFYIEIYDRYGTAISSGSGVFISSDGKALTNHHVVKNAHSAAVMTNDGEVYTVSGYYDAQSSIDMALIQVDGTGFPHLTMDDSGNLTAGQTVFAIGSPKGLDDTISQGIISNANRVLDGLSYIQMTAPISSGSSGGALINDQGLLIGLNTATYLDAQNLNLAVPIHLYRDLSDDTLHSFPLSGSALEYSGAYLRFNTSLDITVGETGRVSVSADPGNYDGDVSIRWDDADESIISAWWDEWYGWDIDLIVTGEAVGTTVATISLLGENDEVLASDLLYITVSAPHSGSSISTGGAYLRFDPLITFDDGTSGAVSIAADAGDYAGDVYILCDGYDESLIVPSWSEWDGQNITLNIYGAAPGITEFDIMLVTENDTILTSEKLTVIVSDFYSTYEAYIFLTEYQYMTVGKTLPVFIQSSSGTCIDDVSIQWNSADTDIVTPEWGAESYDGTYLNLTAHAPGTAEIVISLITEYGELLASEVLTVTVFG